MPESKYSDIKKRADKSNMTFSEFVSRAASDVDTYETFVKAKYKGSVKN